MPDREEMTPYRRSLAPDPAERDERDFYPTPAPATRALMEYEKMSGPVWEPCCGQGHIADVIEGEYALPVVRSDLYEYEGSGARIHDFLSDGDWSFAHGCKTIVTNPPFKAWSLFAGKAQHLIAERAAIFGPLRLLESQRRQRFWQQSKLWRVLIFSDRVPIWRARVADRRDKGGKMVPYAWFIFDRKYSGPPTIDWISQVHREEEAGQ